MSKNTISRAGLIDAVSNDTGQTKKAVGSIITNLLETIADNVSKGNEVSLIGFGKFYSVKRDERIGRNPSNGQEMTISAATLPKFSAGKPFKDKVNS